LSGEISRTTCDIASAIPFFLLVETLYLGLSTLNSLATQAAALTDDSSINARDKNYLIYDSNYFFQEVRAWGKAGWVKYDEMMFNGIQMHFYRKPKRFGN